MIKRRLAVIPAILGAFVGVFPASGQATTPGTGATGGAGCDTVDASIKTILDGKALSPGVDGEPAVAASDQPDLTEEQITKLKEMKATAAMVMHFGGNDWSNAQIAGATSEFERLGIELVATTDAAGDAAKQVDDIETVLAKKPSIVLGIPLDPVATAPAFKKVHEQGGKLVFIDNPSTGLAVGTDYVSYVSADNYANGAIAAHLAARGIGCSGEVGSIRYTDEQNLAVYQRYQGFTETITNNYPDIKIVADRDIGAPDWAGSAEKTASAMLTQNPNIKAIWGFFDIPAEGIIQAAKAAGREDLIVTTCDLGLNIAVSIATGDVAYGTGSQRPYDQGVMEARLGALALLGETVPPYVVLPALSVDKSNVLEAWTEVYHVDPPQELVDAAG